jgi:hypothetical protein
MITGGSQQRYARRDHNTPHGVSYHWKGAAVTLKQGSRMKLKSVVGFSLRDVRTTTSQHILRASHGPGELA